MTEWGQCSCPHKAAIDGKCLGLDVAEGGMPYRETNDLMMAQNTAGFCRLSYLTFLAKIGAKPY